MQYEDFIIEARSSEPDAIKHSAANIYSHLMKCVAYNKMSTSWLGTIFEGCKNILKHEKFISKLILEDPNCMNWIKRESIKIYNKDGNKNAEAMFNIVHNDFGTIYDLKNYQKIKSYVLNIATKNNDFNMIDYINRKY